MTNMFQKAMWSNKNTEATRRQEKEAVQELSAVIDDKNETEFFDKFVAHIDNQSKQKNKITESDLELEADEPTDSSKLISPKSRNSRRRSNRARASQERETASMKATQAHEGQTTVSFSTATQ